MPQWRQVSGSRMNRAIMKKMKKVRETVKVSQSWKMRSNLPKKDVKDHGKTVLDLLEGSPLW
jgi:hypothetical protein